MSQLATKLAQNGRVITAEITPPNGAGIKKMTQHAEMLRPFVDAVNITDCQRALVKMSSLAACRVLLDVGVEPVYQLTCRDRNSIALQSDLMGAWALRIPNVLCLTGDPVKSGDNPTAKSVFELEAIGLLKLLGQLQSGQDTGGNKMNAATKFFVGAVVNPTLQASAGQLARMQKKVEAGARFFQTQANYDLSDFHDFLVKARPLGAKTLAGILILHSYEIAKYIHDNIPGIRLPGTLLDKFYNATNAQQVGIDFAVETMLKMESVCDGFHLMTVREEELIPKVLEGYRAKRDTSQNTPARVSSPTRS